MQTMTLNRSAKQDPQFKSDDQFSGVIMENCDQSCLELPYWCDMLTVAHSKNYSADICKAIPNYPPTMTFNCSKYSNNILKLNSELPHPDNAINIKRRLLNRKQTNSQHCRTFNDAYYIPVKKKFCKSLE